MKAQRGFTLLEVLLAVTIFAIILTSIYGVVAQTVNASRHAEASADLYSSGREIVLRMADEIEGALAPQPGSDIAFIGERGEGSRPNDRLSFYLTVRRVHSSAQRYGGRALVVYSLDPIEGNAGVFALRRHEEFFVPSGLESNDNEDGSEHAGEGVVEGAGTGQMESVPEARYLTDQVAGLRFMYADPKTGEFLDHWDSTEVQNGDLPIGLPAAVQISLFLYDNAGQVHEFPTTVDLPLGNLEPTPGVQVTSPEGTS